MGLDQLGPPRGRRDPRDQIDDYEIWQYTQVPGPNDVYFANRSWVDENTDGVGRFIDALEKAKSGSRRTPRLRLRSAPATRSVPTTWTATSP